MLNTNLENEQIYFQSLPVNFKQENSHLNFYYNNNYYPEQNNNQVYYTNFNSYPQQENDYRMEVDAEEIKSKIEVPKNRGGRKQVKQGTTKRNARERNRVRFINDCFEVLREHIPYEFVLDDQKSAANRKLSKVETLKYATQYIKQLTELLEQSSCQTNLEHSDQKLLKQDTQMHVNIYNENSKLFQFTSSGSSVSSVGSNEYFSYSPAGSSTSSSSYSLY